MKILLPRFATVAPQFWSPNLNLCDADHTEGGRFVAIVSASRVPQLIYRAPIHSMHKASTPIPHRNLDDELWGIEHLACYLGVRISSANASAHHPDFPRAIGGNRRCRKFFADEVRSFVRESRGNPVRVARLPASRTAPEIHDPQRRKV